MQHRQPQRSNSNHSSSQTVQTATTRMEAARKKYDHSSRKQPAKDKVSSVQPLPIVEARPNADMKEMELFQPQPAQETRRIPKKKKREEIISSVTALTALDAEERKANNQAKKTKVTPTVSSSSFFRPAPMMAADKMKKPGKQPETSAIPAPRRL